MGGEVTPLVEMKPERGRQPNVHFGPLFLFNLLRT